jgi:hypothetical protein
MAARATDSNSDIASGVEDHSVVLGVNRQRFWHAMHALLTLEAGCNCCAAARVASVIGQLAL